MARTFDLSRAERALIASGLFALVPGVRLVWAWPWLWLVPGYFFARKVLGAGGFALAVLAPTFGIAFGALVCLPSVIALGGPRPLALVTSVASFALLCAHRRVRWTLRPPPVPPPPLVYTAALAAYVLARIAYALAAPEIGGSDDFAYFVGMVRGLSESFPPVNYAAAASTLRQPWGYWMLYALSHVLSTASIPVSLGVAAAFSAGAFLLLHYAVVALATGDRTTGALTLPLSVGCFETAWIAPSLREGHMSVAHIGYSDQVSYARWLWSAYYDVPALVVGLGAVFLLVVHRATGDRRAIAASAVLFAVMPLFHPVHALVLGLALGFTFVWDLGRRQFDRACALFAVTPLPFLLLYSGLYARSMPERAPFELWTGNWLASESAFAFQRLKDYAGLLVVVAPIGALRPGVARKAVFVLLCALTVALFLCTRNFAHNYHWYFDWMLVAGVTLAAFAFGWVVRRAPVAGFALVGAFVALGVIGDHRDELGGAPVPAQPTPEARRVGAWISTQTPRDATFAVAEADSAAREAVLAIGERRLLSGPPYLLRPTSSQAEIHAWATANRAVLADPCAPEVAGWRVSYVAFGPAVSEAERAVWRARGRRVVSEGPFEVFAPSEHVCAHGP